MFSFVYKNKNSYTGQNIFIPVWDASTTSMDSKCYYYDYYYVKVRIKGKGINYVSECPQ